MFQVICIESSGVYRASRFDAKRISDGNFLSKVKDVLLSFQTLYVQAHIFKTLSVSNAFWIVHINNDDSIRI